MNGEDLAEVDVFKHYYYKLKNQPQTDKEIMDRDMGAELNKYFTDKIEHKELINISIRGEVGTGKSVLALELMRRINELLEKKHKKKIDCYKQIASDQNEFLRLTKDKEEHVCVEIDEISAMGNTGANASTEAAEFQFYSDLCRIFYKHRISCSPINVLDTNAFVLLDIMGKDEINKRTRVVIIYRNMLDGNYVKLGSTWIDVSGILKESWYHRYEKKKLMRVNLMREHGIRDIRELEFAQVAWNVIMGLKGIVESGERMNITATIRMKVMLEMQELYKRPVSFIAEDEMIKPIEAILSGMKAERQAEKNLKPKAAEIIRETYESLLKNIFKKIQILKEYQNIE